MKKQAFFFIDDVIWCFRDIAKNRPASIFDQPLLKVVKEAHDKYGLKLQLNIFYRNDFFYTSQDFTLSDMPADYKHEFEEASDWLKLQFHAKQEFPDYPYVNADYDDVKKDFLQVINEIKRFAGDKSLSTAICPHWLPISREGTQALYDCGIRFITPSAGEKREYDGNPDSLPYGHAARLLQNRKPETMLYTRDANNPAIKRSICAYNHISAEDYQRITFINDSVLDTATGMRFNRQCTGLCLNLEKLEDIENFFDGHWDEEYLGVATHEQYFYSDYYAYQPDYPGKILTFAKSFYEHGFEFITSEQMK